MANISTPFFKLNTILHVHYDTYFTQSEPVSFCLLGGIEFGCVINIRLVKPFETGTVIKGYTKSTQRAIYPQIGMT